MLRSVFLPEHSRSITRARCVAERGISGVFCCGHAQRLIRKLKKRINTPAVSGGSLFYANTFNPKEIRISEVRNDVYRLLTAGDSFVYAFMTIRDH